MNKMALCFHPVSIHSSIALLLVAVHHINMAFHYFTSLPQELRSDIWGLAIAQERTAEVYIRSRLFAARDMYYYSDNPADLLEYAMVPWPTSQTCHEARAEAIRRGYTPNTRVGSLSSICINWNDVELFCPERYAYHLQQANWTEDVQRVSLVNVVQQPFGNLQKVVSSSKALMHGLQRVGFITIRAPVETYSLDEVTCYPVEWFWAMEAIVDEPDESYLREVPPHIMLGPQGLRVEEWLTSENCLYKWYFKPEDVAQIDGKIGQAWWEEFAKLLYCPASVDGVPRLIKLIDATIGLEAGTVQLRQNVEIVA